MTNLRPLRFESLEDRCMLAPLVEFTQASYEIIEDDAVAAAILNDEGFFVIGSDAGGPGVVHVIDAESLDDTTFNPFGADYTGGVRVALGDVNGDGTPDVIAAKGPGSRPNVRVFDGITLEPLPGLTGDFFAFGTTERGGVFVASADINGDGFDDIIAGRGDGTGNVRVISGKNGRVLQDFVAFPGTTKGGVRVAAGDFDGDGTPDIIVSSGLVRGGQVEVYSGEDYSLLKRMEPFGPKFNGGLFIAASDLDEDGMAELIVGQGQNGKRVAVFNGGDASPAFNIQPFTAPGPMTGGVRVAAGDVDGDGLNDIIVGSGAGLAAGQNLRAFDFATQSEIANIVFAGLDEGLFVAGVDTLEPVVVV